MEQKIDYEFLILEELKSYRLYHTKEETMQFMKDIIEQNESMYMPLIFKNIDSKILSENLSNMVLKQIKSDAQNKIDLSSLLPSIVKNSIEITDLRKDKSILGPVLFAGALSIVVALAGVHSIKNNTRSNDIPKTVTSINNDEDKTITGSSIKNFTVTPSALNEDNSKYVLSNLKVTRKKASVKKIKKLNGNSIKKLLLDNFYEIKSLEDIYKRQKELESLNLTKSDKIYKNCKLDPAIQRFIYEQSIINGIPVDFMFSIIATESRGQYNSSGEESYNAPGNYDLGLTQQNTKSALVTFREKYGLSYDEAYELLKYNDYANVVSAFLEVKEIASRFNEFDPIEYAGCYNGWLNWKNYSVSQQYVSIFKKYYYDEFTKYHDKKQFKVKKGKVKVLG